MARPLLIDLPMNIALAFAVPTPPAGEIPAAEPPGDGGAFAALVDAGSNIPPQQAVRIQPAGALIPTFANLPEPIERPEASALVSGKQQVPAAPGAMAMIAAAPPLVQLAAAAAMPAAGATAKQPEAADVAPVAETGDPSGQQAPLAANVPLPAANVGDPATPPPTPDRAQSPATGIAALPAQPAAEEASQAVAEIVQQPAATGTPAIAAAEKPATPPPHPTAEVTLATRPERLAGDVAVEIVRQFSAGRSEFAIRLDPPDLGRIDISLELGRGEVRAVVSTDNPSTYDLLRRDADQLQRLLAEQGFRADGGALRFDLRQDGQHRGFAGLVPPGGASGGEHSEPSDPEPTRTLRRGLLDLVA